jgi:hypothetical protein
MLDSVAGVRKDWKEDWREDAREDWRTDFDAAAGVPANTALPVISGSAWVGQQLSVTTGTWTGGGISYTYAWKRGGVAIGGATASTYTLVLADLGAVITCTVTATNVDGAASATSAGTAAVIDVPANTVAPAITGTAQEGQELSVSNGTWTGGGTIVYTYQWFADDVAIGGATANTYTPVVGDVGAVLHVEVTATNAAGADTAVSNDTAAVIAA